MTIKIWIKYNESYLPTPRCRKLRYRECEDYIDVKLSEVKMSELEPAFDVGYMIYGYAGNLWREAAEGDIHCADRNKPMTAIEALMYAGVTYSTYFGRYDYGDGYGLDESKRENREQVIARAKNDMKRYLLVDGVLYTQVDEPMYNITTFGLGHNHGGTGFFICYHYNPNLSKDSYFNAADYDNAIDYAIRVATGRGDTKDAARFQEDKKLRQGEIKVYNEKFVTRNPQKEHGDGNELLSDMESVIKSSNNVVEAGLLCMLMACK